MCFQGNVCVGESEQVDMSLDTSLCVSSGCICELDVCLCQGGTQLLGSTHVSGGLRVAHPVLERLGRPVWAPALAAVWVCVSACMRVQYGERELVVCASSLFVFQRPFVSLCAHVAHSLVSVSVRGPVCNLCGCLCVTACIWGAYTCVYDVLNFLGTSVYVPVSLVVRACV